MNNRILLLLSIGFLAHAEQKILIDRIEAVVHGTEATELVTKADIERPSLSGAPRSKDEVLLERLMFQDALKYRVMVDEKSIDEYIEKIKKQNNATQDDIKQMFHDAGYTYEEGRRHLGIMQASAQISDYKVRSKILVTEQQVKEYYDEHPKYYPAVYRFERAMIPAKEGDEKEIQKKLDKYAKTHKGIVLVWRTLPDVAESELDENLHFLKKLKQDELSKPRALKDGGFDVFRLRWKKESEIIPFDERYREISEILRKPQYEELLSAYKKELWDNASIIYL
ncbi:peptidyl-prolyl cis-trans isomerase [Candidatus Babeliales bacterium]|nr:peptidyl-prolyl cis-trans isomerase [Candidatus Babeliales bacterium]